MFFNTKEDRQTAAPHQTKKSLGQMLFPHKERLLFGTKCIVSLHVFYDNCLLWFWHFHLDLFCQIHSEKKLSCRPNILSPLPMFSNLYSFRAVLLTAHSHFVDSMTHKTSLTLKPLSIDGRTHRKRTHYVVIILISGTRAVVDTIGSSHLINLVFRTGQTNQLWWKFLKQK